MNTKMSARRISAFWALRLRYRISYRRASCTHVDLLLAYLPLLPRHRHTGHGPRPMHLAEILDSVE